MPPHQVDHLLKEFIKTIKTGLALILAQPSDLTRKVLKENPLWVVSSDMNLMLVTWAAFGAWDKPWAEFCQIVLADSEWQALLAVTD